MLTAPRAAHAVAAALVQITNTAANPAITQNIGQQASQMVHLSCDAGDLVETRTGDCYAFTPQGSPLDSTDLYYTVPSNETLVITSADLFGHNLGDACPTANQLVLATSALYPTAAFYAARWALVANAGTTHFTYPGGLALGPGRQVVVLLPNNSGCHFTADLYGYLTAN